MFYNTPNGLQVALEKGWTISISLSGEDAREDCEIAVWPTGLDSQENWVRWGNASIEFPEADFPIYSRVLSRVTSVELMVIINSLSYLKVEPNKWVSKEFIKSIWK